MTQQDDAQALRDLKKSFQDEHDEVAAILASTADEVEKKAGSDMEAFNQAADELERLEAQADKEEEAGK